MPLVRELLPRAEDADEPLPALSEGDAVERLLQLRNGLLFERPAALAGGVAHVQHDVGDRVVIELREVLGQINPPLADHAMALERQIAVVAQVRLEQAAVILATARRNRLDRTRAIGEARI